MCLWLYNATDNWSFSGLCSSIQWEAQKSQHTIPCIAVKRLQQCWTFEQDFSPLIYKLKEKNLAQISKSVLVFGWYDLTGKKLRGNHFIAEAPLAKSECTLISKQYKCALQCSQVCKKCAKSVHKVCKKCSLCKTVHCPVWSLHCSDSLSFYPNYCFCLVSCWQWQRHFWYWRHGSC